MLFAENNLNIFSDAGFTFVDVMNYFIPNPLFSFTVMRCNKLISNVIDGKTGSGTTHSRISSLLQRKVVVMFHQ